MSADDLGPLDWRIAITDNGGKPTPEFQRRWNTQRNNNSLIGVTLGTGAPTSTPTSSGQQYLDQSQTPPVLYVSTTTGWLRVGVYEFTQLADVPPAYTTFENNLVQVKSDASGLEFTSLPTVLDGLGNTVGSILYRGYLGWTSLLPGTNGDVLELVSGLPQWTTAPATGVTSVGLNLPGIFVVTGSPVTSAGTLTATFTVQPANQFFAGPSSGTSGTPQFRSLVPADIPQFTNTTSGGVPASGGGTTKYLRADGTWDVPPGSGGGGSAGMLPLVNGDINTPSGYDAYPGFILTPDGQCIGVSL